MNELPSLKGQVIAVAWTAVSGIPLAAAVCAVHETVAVPPPEVAALDTTALFRFLTGAQGLLTECNTTTSPAVSSDTSPGDAPSSTTSSSRSGVICACLPRAADVGAMFVGSGVLSRPMPCTPLVRVAVITSFPNLRCADSPANQGLDVHRRARLSSYVDTLLDSLEAFFFPATPADSHGCRATSTAASIIIHTDEEASVSAASYTAHSAKESGTVLLQTLLANTQCRMAPSAPAEEAAEALLPSSLWLSMMTQLEVAMWEEL